MTRVFLAAGVAAMAIAAPATAKPDRERGGHAAQVDRSGAGQRAQRQQVRAERPQRVERQQRMGMQRAERPQRMERQQVRTAQRTERHSPRVERQAQRVERQARPNRVERQQVRVADRQVQRNRVERQQVRVADRQARHDRVERQSVRVANRDAMRADKFDRAQLRTDRQVAQINRQQLRDERRADRQILRDQARWERMDNRLATRDALRTTRLARLDNRLTTQFIEPVRVRSFIGSPLNTVSTYAPLAVLPSSVRYLYPDNDDYYYRYGGGYVYRVERDNDLIDYVLPLLAGAFMPGQYLPTSYMNSYVPNYYGLNSFYPANYNGYGYGYGDPYGYGYSNLCNRYYGGVVYQVDCGSGLIQDVVPLYASGYGVGQMLPSSYAYYNVPSQYRSLYYNTNDYNYWYAPGAIYQYDPSSSMITSVAALLSPGFTVGQPLPMGYNMYNVPMGYRQTYYDTPNAWYRYNNGYIYQVDPTTQLVTAIVASILT